ncbi:MAG: sodium:solute symporter [Candidatus Hydrogenedentota bacterium]
MPENVAAEVVVPFSFTILDWVVLIAYFAGMVAMGPIFASSSKTTEGYLLGDRNFKGWLLGFSMFATSISSVTFMAYPADAYKTAWYRMSPNWVMPIAILVATTLFLPFFRKTHITSAYEYLEGRFGPWTRVYAAAAFIVMQFVRVSLILYLIALLMKNMFGWNPYVCIVAGGVITTFYSVMGGIKAVLWTDFIQSLVLWAGGLIALFVIITKIPGGISEIVSTAADAGKFSMSDISGKPGDLELYPVPWLPDASKGFTMLADKTVLLFMLVGLGRWLAEYCSNQNVIQRCVASKTPGEARVAMWTCCLFSVPTWAMFMFLGTALWVFFQQNPTPDSMAILSGERKAEDILPYFVIHFMPPGITGLVIAAVLAAAMSSLSSSVNSVSAVSLVDIYRRHVAPGRSDDHYVFVAKSVGWGLGVVMIVGATILMQAQNTTLQDKANILTAMTSGGLLGLYLLGFFTKVGDDRAILVAIGFTMLFTLWLSLSSAGALSPSLKAPIFPYYTDLIGHIIFFAVGYTLGAMLPKRDRDLTNMTWWTMDDKPLV